MREFSWWQFGESSGTGTNTMVSVGEVRFIGENALAGGLLGKWVPIL